MNSMTLPSVAPLNIPMTDEMIHACALVILKDWNNARDAIIESIVALDQLDYLPLFLSTSRLMTLDTLQDGWDFKHGSWYVEPF